MLLGGEGATPVPLRLTLSGEPESLEVIWKLEFELTDVAGANLTVMVQDAFWPKEAPVQPLFGMLKEESLGLETPVMFRFDEPVLLTVTCLSEELPTLTDPKDSEFGLMDICGCPAGVIFAIFLRYRTSVPPSLIV